MYILTAELTTTLDEEYTTVEEWKDSNGTAGTTDWRYVVKSTMELVDSKTVRAVVRYFEKADYEEQVETFKDYPRSYTMKIISEDFKIEQID